MHRSTPLDTANHPAPVIPHAYIQGDRFIRLAECLHMTGERPTTCYANIAAGLHPAPIKDGRASLWLLSEIQAYLAQKVARLPRKG